MLRLLNDRVVLGVFPGKLELVRFPRGFRPGTGQHMSLGCELPVTGEISNEPFKVLSEKLFQNGSSNIELRVVVSNHFARYLLLPRSNQLRNEQEKAAYVRFHFKSVFGDKADDWEIIYTRTALGEFILACGTDRALLAELRRTVSQTRLRLASIEPFLAAVFNQSHRSFRGDNDYLALIEPGRICLAGFNRGQLSIVYNQQSETQLESELLAILERDALRQGRARGGNVFLTSLSGERIFESPLRSAGYNVQRLQGIEFTAPGMN